MLIPRKKTPELQLPTLDHGAFDLSAEQMADWLSVSGFSRIQAQRVVKARDLPSAALTSSAMRSSQSS